MNMPNDNFYLYYIQAIIIKGIVQLDELKRLE